MLDPVLKPATADGLAVVAIALNVRTGELDVASNVKVGAGTMVTILESAIEIVRTGRETVE